MKNGNGLFMICYFMWIWVSKVNLLCLQHSVNAYSSFPMLSLFHSPLPNWTHIWDYKLQGRGQKLIGTFSATDLRGCLIATLQSWLPLSALDFTECLSKRPQNASSDSPRELVTCLAESSLAEVIDKAVTNHVHRVWVVDQQGLLVGLVSLTDMIRVLRLSLISDSQVVWKAFVCAMFWSSLYVLITFSMDVIMHTLALNSGTRYANLTKAT